MKARCIVCGSDEVKVLFSKDSVSYAKCRKCDHTMQDPLPDEREILNTYDLGNRYFVDETKGVDFEKGERALIDTARFYISVLSPYIRDYGKRRLNVLDFGCGTGILISEFAKDGHNAIGVELSRWASEFGRKRYHVNIMEGDVCEVDLPENSFDVITMMNSIEHLLDPLMFLERLYRLLKKEGIIVIATPNGDCIAARLFGKSWRYYLPNEHLYIFSPRSLRLSIERAGFTPVDCLHLLYTRVSSVTFCLDMGKLCIKKLLSFSPVPISFWRIHTERWKKDDRSYFTPRDGLICMARK